MFKSAAILGYGSVGKAHAVSARSLCEYVYIIDPFDKPKAQAIDDGFKVFSSIKDLFHEVNNVDHAIVANWGPDHFKSITQLVDNQVNSFTIEKPFCTSISDGIDALEILGKGNAFSNVHFRWSYLDLPSKINNIASRYELGEPIEILCQGGAHCLSTGGIHWIDFAHKLFNKHIISISSNCKSAPINPRSESLMYLEGFLNCRFDHNKTLMLNFSNHTSLPLSVRINYRNSTISIELPNTIKLFTRDKDQIDKYGDKVTRYGPVSLLESFELGARDTTQLVLEEAQQRPLNPKSSAKDGFTASAVIIGALESSNLNNKELLFQDLIDSRNSKQWSFS